MRCVSIKKNKCWKIIKLELTSHSIRLLIDFFHIDVVHLSLLERVGLVGSLNFLFWAFICIMPHILALEAFHYHFHLHCGGSCIHPCDSYTCHCHDYGDACCHDYVDACFHGCGIQNSHYHHNGNTCETIPSCACKSCASSFCFPPASSCSPRWQPCHR